MKELHQNSNFRYIQVSSPSICAKIVQYLLQEELIRRFVASMEWRPSSPTCNLLD